MQPPLFRATRAVLAAILCAALVWLQGAAAHAQFTFASDNADNYGGVGEPGWTNNSDAGFGWGGWNFQNTTSGGSAGQYLTNSTSQGFGNINNTTQSFAMYGNPGGNTGKVGRTLDFSLQDGDSFSIDMAVAFRNGNKGIDLFSGATKLWNFNVGGDQYQANGANLGWSYSQTSIFNLRVTQNSETSMTINLTRGSDSFSTNMTVSGRLNGLDLYVSGTDAGSDLNNFFFNTLLVTNSGLYNVATAQTESRFLTGSGNLAKTGNGTLTISGTSNNFTGTVGITNGAIRATASSALGSASAVTVQSGAALEYSGGIAVGRNLTINGTGISSGGALRNISGDNTHSGALTLGSASRIASDAGILTISGAVSGSNVGLTVGGAGNSIIQTAIGIGSGSLTKEGAGTLTLSGANAYTGGTLISGGRVVGDTRSLQGAITNTAAVTFNQTTNGSYTGLMSGTGGTLTKSGNGTVTLTANNTYTGATTIGGGRLVVNGSQGSSAVTVASGASLGGSGTVGALTVSGLVAPGNSIGTLSAGNTVFNGGGSFELEIFDWVSTAGTGWDLLAITGNLTLSNTSGSPFAINLVSLQDSSTPGLSTDWNPNVNFTNTFITYSGSLLGTSFASNLFTVNTNSFLNPVNGTFSITSVSNGLALLYTTSFAPSSTYTWSAGSGLWGTAGNWTNGATPTNGSSIIFSGAGGASTNSSTVSSVQGIVFTNGAGAYTVSGTALAIGAGGISNASTSAQTISNNLSLSANAAITAAGGNVTLAGNLTNGGNAVTVGGAANTTIGGVISGSGSLIKSGAGSLSLANANTYTGATTISAGTVTAANNASLGATNGSTTVADGATLELSGGVTVAESITITGSGVGGGGAIRSLGNGDNTLGGTITLGGNARINADGPSATPVTVASFGSSGFTVVDEFTEISYSQSSTGLTLTSAGLGALLTGDFASSLNLSGYNVFGVRASVSGANPDLSFNLKLLGSDFLPVRTYQGSTTAFATNSTLVYLTPVSGSGSLASVPGIDWVWGGSGTVSFTLIDLVATSSSGLTISGNIAAGANVLSLGAAGASGGIAGGNITANGVISGAGNTNSGTITSLVKDGSGTLTLGGANSYTGDTRIEGGAVVVNAGGSLGSGSDVFLSAATYLGLRTTTTVSSFQGASNTASIFLDGSGTRLIMNGANNGTIQQNAVIDGSGGLTLAASNTVLRLNSGNTFRGTTVITAGTLALAGTGANQALGSTLSVTVSNSTGKLLLETSNQVRDGAAITLSGGTIQRGSGVSEVFGNLVVNSASFIDFGTGASGILSFGTYTPSSLLTIQNFDFGSTMTFRSNLSSSITNTSLFTFQNGGISSYSWNSSTTTFTITAIPEPSTVLAAVGLLGLMLWSQRGSLRRWASSRVR